MSKFLCGRVLRALCADQSVLSPRQGIARTSTYNSNASDRQMFRKSRQVAAPGNTETVVGTKAELQETLILRA
jgi:hypothetical protein